MAGEAWQLGPSLDALDDLLHGGYGALAGQAQATLIWRDIAHSRAALGVEATCQWLQAKLDAPGSFNARAIARRLQAVRQGEARPTSRSSCRSSTAIGRSPWSRPEPFRAAPACHPWRQPCAPAVTMDGPVPAPLPPPSGAAGRRFTSPMSKDKSAEHTPLMKHKQR